jgi:ribonuclease-3
MEEEPVMVAPDPDELVRQQQNFFEEKEASPAAIPSQQTKEPTQLDLSLDDIDVTPREKTREEIIAEAEAAAFAEM